MRASKFKKMHLILWATFGMSLSPGYSQEADPIPPSVIRIFDQEFSGSKNRTLIWNCKPRFQSFQGYDFYYTRSSLRVAPANRQEALLAFNTKNKTIHLLSEGKGLYQTLKFLLPQITLNQLGANDFKIDFCALVSEIKLGSKHHILDASNIENKHFEVKLSQDLIATPLIRKISNQTWQLLFYTVINSSSEVWSHSLKLKFTNEQISAISIDSKKIGLFVDFCGAR